MPLANTIGRLAPVENVTLQERVYKQLAEALTTGQFRPGELVTLRSLAASLGTSVMPIREAVKRLVAQRALDSLSNRTIRVPPLSSKRFDELCRVRRLVEGEATALAVGNAKPRDIKELERLNEQLDEQIGARQANEVFRTNREFHFFVYELSGSELLVSMIEPLWMIAGPYLAAPFVSDDEAFLDDFEKGTNHHLELISALRRRDPAAARAALQQDISDTAMTVARHLNFRDAE